MVFKSNTSSSPIAPALLPTITFTVVSGLKAEVSRTSNESVGSTDDPSIVSWVLISPASGSVSLLSLSSTSGRSTKRLAVEMDSSSGPRKPGIREATSRVKMRSSAFRTVTPSIVRVGGSSGSTSRSKLDSALAPAKSVAITVTVWVPTSPGSGVPLRSPVMESTINQLGDSGDREKRKTSPCIISGSSKLSAVARSKGNWTFTRPSAIGEDVGLSFTLITLTIKVSSTIASCSSVILRVVVWSPTSSLSGVPENSVPSKNIQPGSSTASATNMAPLSTSENAGVKLNGSSSSVFISAMGSIVGASFKPATSIVTTAEEIAPGAMVMGSRTCIEYSKVSTPGSPSARLCAAAFPVGSYVNEPSGFMVTAIPKSVTTFGVNS